MIYIHVPFCHRKCTYCAFYSLGTAGTQTSRLHAGGTPAYLGYVDALIEEMRQRKGEQAHPIRTVYMGGGTPSLLAISDLERVVRALRECFDLSCVEEVTMECNPEDLTDDYIHGIKQLSFFNRLSIGVQSFSDPMLRLLNRRHTAQQSIDAVERAAMAGFKNITIDLMYGLPGLGSDEWRATVRHAAQLPVQHLSAYALTLEEGTALAAQVRQGRVVMPGDEAVVAHYYALCEELELHGFAQYEVSNFCRPDYHSRHNSRYWDRTPYLGLGPGAHSFDGCRRRWNGRMGVENGVWSVENEEILTEADAFNEQLMTSLRTTAGLPLSAVPDRYKKTLHQKMQRYVDCGWIVAKPEVGGMRFEPTREGLLHADGMAADLFVA